MKVEIRPPEQFKEARIDLPISKSHFNRYLLLKFLSGGICPELPMNSPNDVVLMHGLLNSSKDDFNAEDAGTVMRFGLAMLCSGNKKVILNGSNRMQKRPIKVLVDALRGLGAKIDYLGQEGYPPLSITGQKLEGGIVEVDASVSSQYISALLMIAPLCQNTVHLLLKTKVVSEPYIKLTIDLMRKFGVEVVENSGEYIIEVQKYKDVDLPSVLDWSSAAFFYESLTLFNSGKIFFPGLFKTGQQGDESVTDIFEDFGIRTEEVSEGIRIIKRNFPISNPSVDFTEIPDLFQPVCCAAFGSGISLDMQGLYNLHLKESNRILALQSNLKKFGGRMSIDLPNARLSSITDPHHAEVLDSFNDHRMTMSLAPLSIKYGSIVLDGAECVSKSFPGFWKEWDSMGFEVVEID